MVFVPLPVDLDDSNDEGVLEVGGFFGVFGPLVWAFGDFGWVPGYPTTVAVRGTGSPFQRKGSCNSRGGKVWWGKRDIRFSMCWDGKEMNERNKIGSALRCLSGSFLKCEMELVNPYFVLQDFKWTCKMLKRP